MATSSAGVDPSCGLACEVCKTVGYWLQAARTMLEISVWNYSSWSATLSRCHSLLFGGSAIAFKRKRSSLPSGRKPVS